MLRASLGGVVKGKPNFKYLQLERGTMYHILCVNLDFKSSVQTKSIFTFSAVDFIGMIQTILDI